MALQAPVDLNIAKFGIKGESIICFAGEDWWYHHPHSKNHILRRFAEENLVLFVNSVTLGMPAISNPDFFLKIRRKLRSYARWLRRAPEGLWIMTPVSMPFFGSQLVRFVNRWLLSGQLKIATAIIGIQSPIVWAANPFAIFAMNALHPKLLIYHVSDKYDANEDGAVSPAVIREADRWFKKHSALVLYSGQMLFEEAGEAHRYFLEQAVDFDHFACDPGTDAPDIADIPRPVLGYLGTMELIMDGDLVREVSRRRPDWHWVFVGTRSNHFQVEAPNVHFLGPKPYSELPHYVRHIDVCVLPWRVDNTFTSYGSAIKVKEYLATGKPVVIAPLYEYLKVPGIRLYRNVEEFIAAVEHALEHDTLEMKALRQDAVRAETWDARATQIGLKLAEMLDHPYSAESQTCHDTTDR